MAKDTNFLTPRAEKQQIIDFFLNSAHLGICNLSNTDQRENTNITKHTVILQD